jgi:ribosomal protein S25
MAKRISQVQRVLNTDVQKLEQMTRAELAHEVSILVSAANKRIRRLEKEGFTGDISTPALSYTMRHGGMFSVKGKNETQLLNELKRAKGFINAKTSTVRGANKSIEEMNKMLSNYEEVNTGKKVERQMTKEELAQYWRAVDRLRELQPSTFNAKCLEYKSKIRGYVKRGRTGRQTASYVNRMIEKSKQEIKQKASDIDEEMRKYGENELGNNNL